MTALFDYDPERAAAALARMRAAPDARVTVQGEDWTHGAMGALVAAELLAAEAGVVPMFELPTGEKGILAVGAAREHIDTAPEDVRTLYLATHRIVRSTHASALPATGDAPALGDADDLGAIPLVLVLVVIGVAAVIAGAAYFLHRDAIEVEGRNVRTTAIAAEAANLARDQLAKTGRIDPNVWETFRSMAEMESHQSSIPLVIMSGIALAACGAAGVLAWREKRAKGGRARESA